jgi:hypothetical protein
MSAAAASHAPSRSTPSNSTGSPPCGSKNASTPCRARGRHSSKQANTHLAWASPGSGSRPIGDLIVCVPQDRGQYSQSTVADRRFAISVADEQSAIGNQASAHQKVAHLWS